MRCSAGGSLQILVIFMKEINITKNDSGQRIDKFLLKYFGKAPKSFVYKMLRKKRIKLNGGRAEGSEMLSDGDKVQMYLSDETVSEFVEIKEVARTEIKFDIIYEDKNILAVNKPAGILSHAETNYDNDTLIDQVLYYLNEKGEYIPERENSFTPALCNRLDRNTSGVVLVGKNAEALRQANEAVKDKNIKKIYLAIVSGSVKGTGRLENLYCKNKDANKASIGIGDKKIITEYKPIKTNGKYTLMEIELITGKSHQIRLHMSSINCPIIGDIKYGNDKENQKFRRKIGVKRQLLHAYRMELGGFRSELEYLNGRIIEADTPQDFKRTEKEIFERQPN